MKLVEATHCNEGAESDSKGVENLRSSCSPDFGVNQLPPIRLKVELDALSGAWQGGPADQQNDKHNVWKSGGEVNHLSGGLNALP